MTKHRSAAWGAGLLLLATAAASAGEVPLGRADYVPSASHPVGERGDWTGVFPGAKDVALEWDHRTGKNIVWKCRLPYWSNSSPIVVGKKVFVGSEPDELVCIDAEKGVVLWTKSVFIDLFIPEADRAGVRTALREANDEAQAVNVPGLVAAQWVAALKPVEDAAVSETAKRIAEVRERIKAKGLDVGKLSDTQDAGILSRAGEALLETHKIVVKRKGRDGPFFHGNWAYHNGFTMPTPVSDGKSVWYQTALGAVACLDLDGKLVWSLRTPTDGPTTVSHFSGCGSPVLIGERLFYTIGGKKVFAVEKATGKEIWNHDAGKDGIGGRGSAGIIPLRIGGRDFIQCPALPILDANTGQLAGKLLPPPGGGVGPMDARRGHTACGDSVIYTGDMCLAREQIVQEGDKLVAKMVWSAARAAPWHCSVVFEGNVYFPKGTAEASVAWLPFDGSGVLTAQGIGKLEPTWRIPKDMISPPEGGKKSSDVAKCWQYAAASVASGHLFVGDDTQGMLVVKLAGAKSEIVSRNFMDLFIRGNPFFQGNRMYVRSMHYLYCIAKTN